MPTIHFDLREPDGSAADGPAVGTLLLAPTRSRVVDDHLVLPEAFKVDLVAGVADVLLAASGLDWCWKIIGPGTNRYVTVPESATPINYVDLLDVDPTTFSPTAVPEAAWNAALTAGLAGVFAGSALSAADIDTITTPGSYYQTVTANVTAGNHYPVTGMAVTMIVTAAGTSCVQILWAIDAALTTKAMFQRRHNGTSWGAWGSYSATRWDQTAGRAAYSWDTINNREQLVYGDTGWRALTPQNGWTATALFVRRIGTAVHVAINAPVGTAATTNAISEALPAGFWPRDMPTSPWFPLFTSAQAPDATRVVAMDASTHEVRFLGAAYTGVNGGRTQFTYPTNDTWPVTLPGAASGTIPNL